MRKEGKRDGRNIERLIEELHSEALLSQILSDERVLRPNGLANQIARQLEGKLKATQLRKVFDKIKEIENALSKKEEYKTKILELYPKLAYSTGRGLIPKNFYRLLTLLLEKAEKDTEDAERVIKLITAILAYSKLYKEGR